MNKSKRRYHPFTRYSGGQKEGGKQQPAVASTAEPRQLRAEVKKFIAGQTAEVPGAYTSPTALFTADDEGSQVAERTLHNILKGMAALPQDNSQKL